jgi:hypothetical protein
MARVTETPIAAFAHCVNPMCRGRAQQPVDAIQKRVEISYFELGGDMPGIERSSDHVLFAHDADVACPSCGGPREVTDQERPIIPSQIGQQDFLLKLIQEGLIAGPGEDTEKRLAALEGKLANGGGGQDERIAALEAQIQALTAALEGKANKPGPKPKVEGG